MTENADSSSSTRLAASITWKQGLFIALGVPILILPSLVDVAGTIWAFSIVMWTICVLQGFLQNTAYGEMITTLPGAAGLPGCAQIVFTPEVQTKKYDTGKLIGAFCAWCYWFAWAPVVAIFTLLIGDYIIYYAGWDTIDPILIYIVLGLVVVTGMTLISARGLTGGAVFGLILAIVAIVPLVVILAGTFFSGDFQMSNISDNWLPVEWTWSMKDIAILFGVFALAQWSGCAWETAAVYGPEYKDPSKDVPKALFLTGFICLILYFFVAFATFGSLTPLDIGENGYHTYVPIAEGVFGTIGGPIAITLLIVAMVLIVQTGFLGSSRTMYYMAEEGNLPKYLKKKNKHGMPINAFITVSVVNMILIATATVQIGDLSGGPVMILAASAIAYCIAHVIALSAYVKSKTDIRFKDLVRPFSAPKGWKYVAAAMVFYEAVVLIPCLVYWMMQPGMYGALTIAVGLIILLVVIPIWFWTQNQNAKENGTEASE